MGQGFSPARCEVLRLGGLFVKIGGPAARRDWYARVLGLAFKD